MQGKLLNQTIQPSEGQSTAVDLPRSALAGGGRESSIGGVGDGSGISPFSLVNPSPRQRSGGSGRVLGDGFAHQRPAICIPKHRPHLKGTNAIFYPNMVNE